MEIYVYILFYFISAALFIALKTSLRPNLENFLKRKGYVSYNNILTLTKAIPLIIAIVFSYYLRSKRSDVFLGIFLALIFCLLGDYFIDRSLIQGMLLFAIAHIFFIFSFLYATTIHLINFSATDFIVLSIITSLIILYDYTFLRYMNILHIPQKYILPVTLYTILLSFMFASSVWLTYLLTIGEVIILPLGTLLFVVSDSMIAMREFSGREIKNSSLYIMGTYYSAIFLISLTVMYI